jgi:hypothetical protein
MKKKSSDHDGQLPLPEVARALEVNQGPRPKGMPSLAVIRQETARLGLPDSDSDFIFDSWLANGFRTKTGKIRDWKASLRNYVRNSWLPSLKRANKWDQRDRESEELARIKKAKERANDSY